MKKVLILGALVVLAGSASYAQTQNFLWTPNAPNAGLGETYNSVDIWNVDLPPVPLPIPTFDLESPVKGAELLGAPGPMGSISMPDKGGPFGGATGSAIISPRGGSFMSPRREADMQIRKLIGKID